MSQKGADLVGILLAIAVAIGTTLGGIALIVYAMR